MNKYNLKSIALPGLVVAEFRDYYGRTEDLTPQRINFNQKIVDAALQVEPKKINKNEIVYVKASVEKDLYDSRLRTLNVFIKTQPKNEEVDGHRIYVPIDRLSSRESNLSQEREYQTIMSIFCGLMSAGLLYFHKTFPVYAIVTSLLSAAMSLTLLYNIMGSLITSKKNKNILLALTALEEGIKTANNAQKALDDSQKTKRKK